MKKATFTKAEIIQQFAENINLFCRLTGTINERRADGRQIRAEIYNEAGEWIQATGGQVCTEQGELLQGEGLYIFCSQLDENIDRLKQQDEQTRAARFVQMENSRAKI